MWAIRPVATGSVRVIRGSISSYGRKEAQQYRPSPRPERRDFAVALEEDANVDGVLMNWAESGQMLDDSVVHLTNPAGMPAEEFAHRDARNTNVRLVSRRELTLTVRARPTRHSPIVPQATATD